jgi:K+-transporting ATPase ATPase C chain
MRTQLRPALGAILIFTVLTGIGYPLVVTGIAQLFFPHQANGSLILQDGQRLGSELIGQSFNAPEYFWGRPSATSPIPYNASASAGSNLGLSNPTLTEAVEQRIAILRADDPTNIQPIPVDLVTASASGLDAHISVAAAIYQIPRVARVRGMGEDALRILVEQYTEGRQFGFLGEARVNVLELNLALSEIK